jgi:hypothetical protein
VAWTKSHEIPVAVDGIVKSKTLFMLRGNYLKDLLYFYFGMQLGIDLCEAINVHGQYCPRCEKLT